MWQARLILGWAAVFVVTFVAALCRAEAETNQPLPLATNLAAFSRLGSAQRHTTAAVDLAGIVDWVSNSGDEIVFQDDSGAERVELGPQHPVLHAGQRIRLSGFAGGTTVGMDRGLGSMLLVDNDGAHGIQEKAGSIFLAAGKYPLQVSWFARDSAPALEVWYAGPDLPRQRVPASVLFRQQLDPGSGAVRWIQGLECKAYEGEWWQLPEFCACPAVNSGAVANFDLTLRTRDTFVGLSFSGFIDIRRDGYYTFPTISDAGSRLFLQLLQVQSIGRGVPPGPQVLIPGQVLPDGPESQWATVEGKITFAGRDLSSGWSLELSSPRAHMLLKLASTDRFVPACLLNCTVRITGLCRSTCTQAGERVPGAVWVPCLQEVQVLEVPPELWNSAPAIPLQSLTATNESGKPGEVVRARGRVQSMGEGTFTLSDGTGWVTLLTTQPLPSATNILLDALVTRRTASSKPAWQCLFYQPITAPPASPTELPLLTTIEQIKRLKRSEALRGYPVHVRGVVTWSAGSAVVLQDATAGIFVSQVPVTEADGLRAGEFWDVSGVTFAQFSPMILARQVVRLGLTSLPDPLRPTWDQLINGSLDTQFVEVRGVVTALWSNTATLLIHGGKIQLALPEMRPEELKPYDGTLVRVRGCLWAVKDETTHVFRIGEVEIHSATIEMEEEAPADLFAAPHKRVAELLLYDAGAGAFQRVMVSGQVVHSQNNEFCLMDGSDGLRLVPKIAVQLRPGDLVEVAGFPELGGPSPVLREAVVRRTGWTPLPEPTPLSEDNLLDSRHDSTLVRVQAQLAKRSTEQKDQVLGLQLGQRNFIARLTASPELGRRLRLGSRLELTGAYVGRGGDRAAGRDIDSFELLLNQPADIRLLAQPSWWTLRRLLAIMGVLVTVLGIASVWIGLLRKQVEQRTAQLKLEIHEREQAEHQRAVEAERSRIARDLHDDLGSSLTEISLLADAGPGSPPTLDKAGQRFRKIGDKARAAVNGLDVIVWLVNPRKDVLPFLAGYLASYAEEYLSACGLACRLKMPREIPPIRLTAEVRHSVFLAVKETLRNIVRHAHASEVAIELSADPGQLTIVIADNGRGFEYRPELEGNGLSNLRDRLAGIGGRCEIASRAEAGTRVTLALPLNGPAPKNL